MEKSILWVSGKCRVQGNKSRKQIFCVVFELTFFFQRIRRKYVNNISNLENLHFSIFIIFNWKLVGDQTNSQIPELIDWMKRVRWKIQEIPSKSKVSSAIWTAVDLVVDDEGLLKTLNTKKYWSKLSFMLWQLSKRMRWRGRECHEIKIA